MAVSSHNPNQIPVALENVTRAQPIKIFPPVYETRRLIFLSAKTTNQRWPEPVHAYPQPNTPLTYTPFQY
jgi:hypothetical protein